MVEAYPLHWPEHQKRTERPQSARFDTSFAIARDSLISEISRLGGKLPVISSNIPLRRDRLPYASAKAPDDAGVAVYFEYQGEQVCFACDKWNQVKDNIQAIRKTLDALRGIERWGSTDMMQRAFRGFAELPPPDQAGGESWQEILQVGSNYNINEVERNFRLLARDCHPDTAETPNPALFQKLVKARAQARSELS